MCHPHHITVRVHMINMTYCWRPHWLPGSGTTVLFKMYDFYPKFFHSLSGHYLSTASLANCPRWLGGMILASRILLTGEISGTCEEVYLTFLMIASIASFVAITQKVIPWICWGNNNLKMDYIAMGGNGGFYFYLCFVLFVLP